MINSLKKTSKRVCLQIRVATHMCAVLIVFIGQLFMPITIQAYTGPGSQQRIESNPVITIKALINDELKLTGVLSMQGQVNFENVIKIYRKSAGQSDDGEYILQIKSIYFRGSEIEFNRESDWIEVPDIDGLEIHFEIDLIDVFDWRANFGYIIFPGTYSDVNWYPDIYVDGSRNYLKDFYLSLDSPEKLTVMTSGRRSSKTISSVMKKEEFSAKRVRYFSLNAGWDFILDYIDTEYSTIYFFSDRRSTDKYKTAALETASAIRWFEEEYGFFPRERIAISQGNGSWSGGFPSENVFYIHQGNFTIDFLQWITSHELGHYFWGLHVLSATEDELDALMLANGVWIDHLYLSEKYGLTLEETWNSGVSQANMMGRYIEAILANREQEVGISRKEQNKFDFDYNSKINHGKASVGLYLLSREYGIDNFLNAQRELLELFKGRPLSVELFLEYLTENGDDFPKRFYEQWTQDHATIEYAVEDLNQDTVNGKNQYSFNFVRYGTVDYPIEIKLIDQNGQSHDVRSKGIKEVEIISGLIDSKIAAIKLDPKGIVPMWNSSNPEMQKNYIKGLIGVGKVVPAEALLRWFEEEYPNDKEIESLYEKIEGNL